MTVDRLQEAASVVVDPSVLDAVAVAIGVQHDVARSEIVGDRVADTAKVDGSHASEDAIGRLMRVPREHQVRLGTLKLVSQFRFGSMGCDSVAIVSAR
jgi:hypothetical protein